MVSHGVQDGEDSVIGGVLERSLIGTVPPNSWKGDINY